MRKTRKYCVIVSPILSALAQAIGDFGETNPLRGTDSNLLTLEQATDWKTKATSCIETIYVECDKFQNFDLTKIPKECYATHKEIFAATRDFKKMTASFLQGVTNFDSKNLDEMMKYLNSGTEHLQDATFLLNEST
jgi:hypothetical protein